MKVKVVTLSNVIVKELTVDALAMEILTRQMTDYVHDSQVHAY